MAVIACFGHLVPKPTYFRSVGTKRRACSNCLSTCGPPGGYLSQVLRHEWVTDSGKLPPVQHYSGSSSQWVGDADAHTTEQAQVLTALKKQVSPA